MNEGEEIEKLKERIRSLEEKFEVLFDVTIYLLREVKQEEIREIIKGVKRDVASMTEEEKKELIEWHKRFFSKK